MDFALMPLATMTREVQNLCRAGLRLIDLDIENCQFNIEEHFMMTEEQKQRYPNKLLYNRERSSKLEQVCKHYNCCTSDAKQLFISLGNAGQISAWKQEKGINAKLKDLDFVRDFAKECADFIEEVTSERKHELDIVTSWGKPNPEGTLFFYTWTHFERLEINGVMSHSFPGMLLTASSACRAWMCRSSGRPRGSSW